MSLTSFLQNKDVKDAFKQEFKKPPFKYHADLLAPPLTNHYGLVGTAFDYLLRFYIKYLNPQAREQEWVSMASLDSLTITQLPEFSKKLVGIPVMQKLNEKIATNPAFSDPTIYKRVIEIIQHAKNAYSEYIKKGAMSHDLFKSVLLSEIILIN